MTAAHLFTYCQSAPKIIQIQDGEQSKSPRPHAIERVNPKPYNPGPTASYKKSNRLQQSSPMLLEDQTSGWLNSLSHIGIR